MGAEDVVLQMEGFLLLLKHDKILDFFFSGITTAASLIMLIYSINLEAKQIHG